MSQTDTVLEVSNVSRSFGGFKAVDGVSISVKPAGVHAVIGPNGAGKSTLFNLISGLLKPDSGSVVLNGRDITGRKLHHMTELGMGRAFQITNVFPEFSVFDSVELAVNIKNKKTMTMVPYHSHHTRAEVEEVLELVGLMEYRNTPARELSHGDQRSLEMALALAAKPSILLLDEPTAGMAPSETSRVAELMRSLVEKTGVTILFCEHDVPTVFGVSDFISVMHQGQVLVEGTPNEIQGNQQVREVYLGVE